MTAQIEVEEYLDEIRREVCSRCVERPPGGPPCEPLGKRCGVELHLPRLIDSIHEVHSDLIEPYLTNNRRQVCAHCARLGSDCCPCPMDYLSVLIVQAVEAVDERLARQAEGRRLAAAPGVGRPELEEVREAFEAATGNWTGCDWPTSFGPASLDLNGWMAFEAAAMACECATAEERKRWEAAAQWLAEVERIARKAEGEAALAVAAAGAGKWVEARRHAWRAWSLEFATGRPLRNEGYPAWRRLYTAVENAAAGHPPVE
jgi:hypothetical protein